MENKLETLNAYCDKANEFIFSMQELIDEYYNFTFVIKDNQIKENTVKALKDDLRSNQEFFEQTIENLDVEFETKNKFRQDQIELIKKIEKECKKQSNLIRADEEDHLVTIRSAIGNFKVMMAEIDVMFRSIEMPNTSTDQSDLYIAVSTKVLDLYKKLQNYEKELDIIHKSLETKLVYSSFLQEVNDEFMNKNKILSTHVLQCHLKNDRRELLNYVNLMVLSKDDFVNSATRKIKEDKSIPSLIKRYKQSKDSAIENMVTGKVFFRRDEGELKRKIFEDLSPIVENTKKQMVQISNKYEAEYAQVIAKIYEELNSAKKRDEDVEMIKQQLEKDHFGFISSYSSLYSFFFKDWPTIVVNKLTE